MKQTRPLSEFTWWPKLPDFTLLAYEHYNTDKQRHIKANRKTISYNWAATSDYQQCGILTSVDSYEPVQPHFKLRNSKWCSVSSLTVMEIQATSKGSDQTARMRRLIWGFTGRTYHIVRNLMPRLIGNFMSWLIIISKY